MKSPYNSKEAPNWLLKTAFFFLCLNLLTDAYFIGHATLRLVREYPKNLNVNVLTLLALFCICWIFLLYERRPNGLIDDVRELFRRYKKPSVDEDEDDDNVKPTTYKPTKHSKMFH